jgi:hypothetical protein
MKTNYSFKMLSLAAILLVSFAVMNPDGSNPTNLTNNAALDTQPDWQPV